MGKNVGFSLHTCTCKHVCKCTQVYCMSVCMLVCVCDIVHMLRARVCVCTPTSVNSMTFVYIVISTQYIHGLPEFPYYPTFSYILG